MPTVFEKLPEFSPAQADDAWVEFIRKLERAQVAFEPTEDGRAYVSHQNKMPIRVSFDETHGIVMASVDTKVVLPADNLDLFWAYASFCSTFVYKHCRLTTAPEGSAPVPTFSWRAGERIHYYVEGPLDVWKIDELVLMVAKTGEHVRSAFRSLDEGETDLRAIVAAETEAPNFRRMFGAFDDEDDE